MPTQPPKHTLTATDLDRLVRLVAGLAPIGADADLIQRCRAIEPGHIVEVEARGKVHR